MLLAGTLERLPDLCCLSRSKYFIIYAEEKQAERPAAQLLLHSSLISQLCNKG